MSRIGYNNNRCYFNFLLSLLNFNDNAQFKEGEFLLKIVIIGASHGGLQAALTLKRLDSNSEVILIEKRDEISYISSGLMLKINQLVDELDDARYVSEEQLRERGIKILLRSVCSYIDPDNKQVTYQDEQQQEIELSYDKLIIATGSNQFSTNLTLPDNGKVTVFKDYPRSQEVFSNLEKANVISIIGGGYIGVELCDALKTYGKEIHLIESADSLLFRYLDKELSEVIELKLKEAGVILHLNENVISFEDTEKETFITRTTTEKIENDYVVIAVNARPETCLVDDFLDLNSNGTIRVNKQMQTSDPDIFALGDVISYPVQNSYRKSFIPLINNVVRSATVAAMNVLGNHMNYATTQKTSATKIFDYYVASTGLTEVEAKFEGIEVESIFLNLPFEMSFVKEHQSVYIKLVFAKGSHQLVGGQLMSTKDITQTINTLSLAVANKLTLEDLVTADFYFNPSINRPMGIIGQTAYEFMLEKYKL